MCRPYAGRCRYEDAMTIYTSHSRPGESAPVTWWSRFNKAVLGAGALATAVTAVVSLWPDAPAERTASFSSVRITAGVPLGEYEQRLVAHTRGTAMAPAALIRSDAPAADDGSEAPTPGDRADPGTPSTGATSPDAGGSADPDRNGGPGRPREVPTQAGPPGPDADWPPPAATESVIEPAATVPAPRESAAAIAAPACAIATCGRLLALLTWNYPTGSDGRPLTADQAAERVAQRLKQVRTTTAKSKRKRQPLGVVVAVDLELSGLRGRPLTLSWSMWQQGGETRLYGDWLNENLAYRIKAASAHDTASIDFWIPLPRTHGPYFVRSRLSSNGVALASADTDPFR
jgi:hypothetical protein